MQSKHPDLLVVFIISLLTLILGISGIRSGNIEYETMPLWMAPLGILMVLFVPGYAIVSATMPKLGSEKKLLISLGLSISISALGGLVLNMTPWGLTPRMHSLWLSSIALIGIIIAWYQRRTHNHNFEVGVPVLHKENIIIFGLAGYILIGAVLIAYISSRQTETAFTQLWAIPTVTTEGTYEVQIGIRNEEDLSETYNLYIDINGRRLDEWSKIPLKSGDEWTTTISLPEKPSQPIRISLYRIQDPVNVYRWLRISPETFK